MAEEEEEEEKEMRCYEADQSRLLRPASRIFICWEKHVRLQRRDHGYTSATSSVRGRSINVINPKCQLDGFYANVAKISLH